MELESDPTAEIIGAIEADKEELARDAIMFWFEKSQNWLEEAAAHRSEIDSEGKKGRESNGLHALQQMAQPPSYDSSEEVWSFSYPHEGAVFQEFGARAHEIRARRAEKLAFHWPDTPEDKKHQWSHLEGDLVMMEKVDHPGIPAIGFVRRGRDKMQTRLDER